MQDAILTEILAGSNKTATTPSAANESKGVSAKTKAPAVGASLLSQLAQDDQEMTDLSQLKAASTPSTEVTGKEVKCPHAKQAVKIIKLRRQLAQLKELNKCDRCEFEYQKTIRLAKRMAEMSELMAQISLENTPEPEPLPLEAAWMCLSCCQINCGRAIKKHAVMHSEAEKGEHPLAINLSTMECWCYACDESIVPSKSRNQIVAEYQSIVEKSLQIKQSKQRAANAALAKKTKSNVVEKPSNNTKVYTPGLQNLGNTCFFNSVVQVLTETKTLRQILSDKAAASESAEGEEKKEKEAVPAPSTALATKELDLPPSLAATTEAGLGPLTSTFKALLHTMWKQQGGTVTPRDLFTQITKKWKVFRGFRQQDSQELMRYLFDGLEQEENDLIKRHIAENSPEEKEKEESKDSKDAPSTAMTKFVPFIDSCFSGKLVSVIVCDACKKCSYSYEPYFDLSLPVKSARGLDPSGSSMKSRLRANALGNNSLSETATINSVDSESTLIEKEEEKDVIPVEEQGSPAHLEHVQKLLKTIDSPKSMNELSIERSLVQFTSVDVLDEENRFACENCYKILRGGNDKKSVDEKASALEKDDEAEKAEKAEKAEEEKKEKKDEDEEKKKKDESAEETDKDTSEEEPKMDVDAAESDDTDVEEEEEELTDSLGNTIERPSKKGKAVAKSSDVSGAQKTGKESQPKEEPKYLKRKAFKRYLVASLPPTLVLHLKRFETAGSRFGMMRKIDDHVEIPEELDMSPFCIPKKVIEEEDEPKKEGEQQEQSSVVVEDQENVSKKYRLYGIVVHQGTLGSGHYTNYVLSSKVETLNAQVEALNKSASATTVASTGSAPSNASSALMPDIPLAEMLAQQQAKKKGGKKGKGSAAAQAAQAAQTAAAKETSSASETVPAEEAKTVEPQPDARQWLYCSDTHVRLSSLEEALNSNAYLLFYERV
ncbi:Ubiquitin carboxyl-terminal hydrolase 16 [Actinomortierella wolfii]|nr:Ubiquitin carboxyl-terminal hydrolase 16 [Actinomortierella wolfii]